jgi:hypothetical protein
MWAWRISRALAAERFIVEPVPAIPTRAACGYLVMLGLGSFGCTSVDPGPNFVSPEIVFDANYFYCHVEPGLITAYNCGPGDPSKGDGSGGCHFTESVVSGMYLLQHNPVDCGGGDIPLDPTQVAIGSAAQGNFETVSLEMSKDYTIAPIYTRPSSYNGQPPSAHPRAVFDQSDATVIQLLSTWASK